MAVDAFGERKLRRALSGVEVEGHDFPIVWLVSEEEWETAQAEGREPEGRVPWPAEDVTPTLRFPDPIPLKQLRQPSPK
jgi:hypothetical protein